MACPIRNCTLWSFFWILEAESDGNYPSYPNYRLFLERPPPLKLNLYRNYPHYPNNLQFLKRPHPHSVFILCAWYTIWVLILIKSIVLSLFLAFIILSDLYYPHHPPTEGCTFRSRKKGILYIQPQSRFSRQRSLRSSFRPEVTGVTKPTGLYTPATFPRRFWWVKFLRRASSTFPETTYGSTPL